MPQSWSHPSRDAQSAAPVILASVNLLHEEDVVLARQRAKQIAQLLGFEGQDQVRVATAASEIAREGLQTGSRRTLNLCVDSEKELFLIRLQCLRDDAGRSSADFASREGVIATRRIMGHFAIVREENGTAWEFGRALPRTQNRSPIRPLGEVAEIVAAAPPRNLYEEFQAQNKELLESLQELRQHQHELAQANRELEETNRGVVALYAELEEQAQSLRRTNEQKTRFYSSISHEFRTPVTSILSLSQILIDRLDGELTAEQERQILLIRRCGQNLLEWVNDLLDLARADAGRMDLRLSRFTAYDLLTGLRGIMRPLACNDNVELKFDDVAELQNVVLHSDEGKLSQILRNLISNALKFTERGEVRVSVDLSAVPADAICITVHDTGIGISLEDQSRIFDEFVQVESPLQRKARGTGLGLPLSRRLAALLGGSIRVESVVGRGSVFRLVVPRQLSAPPADPKGKSSAADPGNRPGEMARRALVLVIDDDEASRYLLKQALSNLPVEVCEAASGLEGLRQVEEVAPQAIFLDLTMPEIDGFEVLESLKQDSATREIPVVIYTSREDDFDSDARLSGQAFAVLHKPSGEEGPPFQQIRETLARAGVIKFVPE